MPARCLFLFMLCLLTAHLNASQPLSEGQIWAAEILSSRFSSGGISHAERPAMQQKLAKALGVYHCEESPSALDEEQLKSNLLTSSWGGWRLSTWHHDKSNLTVVNAHNLTHKSHGPSMTLEHLKAGTYELSGWVKLDSHPGSHSLLHTAVWFPDSHQTLTDSHVAATVKVKTRCWAKVQGGFRVAKAGRVRLQVGVSDGPSRLSLTSFRVGVVDTDRLTRQQNAMIDKIRKRKVVLTVRNRAGNPVKAFAEVEQTSSSFPFGAATAGAIVPDFTFQQWFIRRFSWTVFQNELKWMNNEPSATVQRYDDADAMVATFRALNLTIRGHCVVWDPIVNIQGWLLALNRTQLRARVNKRVRDTVGRYAGQFAHWDINNEYLHGRFFEESLADPYFGANLHRAVLSLDPTVHKFVNDYNVVEYYNEASSTPETMLEQVDTIRAGGGEVDGIGLQGHFGEANPVMITAVLNALAVSGIPLWLTELDFNLADKFAQATALEIVLRATFSHPGIRGIMQWEVARRPCEVRISKASPCGLECRRCSTDVNWNDRPTGLTYLRLRNEWTTRRNSWLSGDKGTLSFRAFFGTYKVGITVAGTGNYYSFNFTVPEASGDLRVNIDLPE